MAFKMPKQWSKHQRRAFKGVKRLMREEQTLFTHPNAAPIPVEHWETVAHNAAWMAAEYAEEC